MLHLLPGLFVHLGKSLFYDNIGISILCKCKQLHLNLSPCKIHIMLHFVMQRSLQGITITFLYLHYKTKGAIFFMIHNMVNVIKKNSLHLFSSFHNYSHRYDPVIVFSIKLLE